MSIESKVGNIVSWIKNHPKEIIALLFTYLLLGTPLGLMIVGLNTVNPGFPGAYANCYGVNFKGFGTDWTGVNMIHPVNLGETTLVTHTFGLATDRIYWGAGTGPEGMTCVWDYPSTSVGPLAERQIATEVQSNIPLAAFNYQNSTPLTFSNVSAWDDGTLLQYWNVQASTPINQTLSDGTILSSVTYTATSQSLLLIPGNFYLSVYIPPSQHMAGLAGSGWQEGTWTSLDFWYVIYWYEWLNAYGPVLKANEAPPNIPADALNRQEQFNLRGGFPITGWIQGYDSPIQTSNGVLYDVYSFYSTKTGSSLASAQILDPTVLKNIIAHIQMMPGLVGRQVVLYTQPSDQYQLPLYNLPSGPIDNNSTVQGLLNSPDFQTILPAEYFKIGVQSLGTDTEGDWWNGWTVYYPTVNYLLRFIFGVYGTHTYVWTVQTAIQQGYNATANYQVPPAQWQNRTTVSTFTPGVGTGWDLWWENPWNQFQVWAIVAVIVILTVLIVTRNRRD